MSTKVSPRTLGELLAILGDPWCRRWLNEFADELVHVHKSERENVDAVLDQTLELLDVSLDRMGAWHIPCQYLKGVAGHAR